jgi:hypothetical protein
MARRIIPAGLALLLAAAAGVAVTPAREAARPATLAGLPDIPGQLHRSKAGTLLLGHTLGTAPKEVQGYMPPGARSVYLYPVDTVIRCGSGRVVPSRIAMGRPAPIRAGGAFSYTRVIRNPQTGYRRTTLVTGTANADRTRVTGTARDVEVRPDGQRCATPRVRLAASIASFEGTTRDGAPVVVEIGPRGFKKMTLSLYCDDRVPRSFRAADGSAQVTAHAEVDFTLTKAGISASTVVSAAPCGYGGEFTGRRVRFPQDGFPMPGWRVEVPGYITVDGPAPPA